MRHKVLLVAGARPNFMKIAPLLRAMRRYKSLSPVLVHTGQHYDFRMSEAFFRDLRISEPDRYLGAGSGTHSEQTARVLARFERVLLREKPDLVVVVGDVNSTLACALAASKQQIPVAHVEAGLRSFDRSMPEEINRIVTDRLSDFLFVSEPSGMANLRREGVDPKRFFFVGNVMIDSLFASRGAVNGSRVLQRLRLKERGYGVLTLHRPSNVDSRESWARLLTLLKKICREIPLVYPVHPRAEQKLKASGLRNRFDGVRGLKFVAPLGYVDFIKLIKESLLVMTDSGGIQEETTVLGIPCLTMRRNTERPVTISQGTNRLVGTDGPEIFKAVRRARKTRLKKKALPHYWDGRAAERIVRILHRALAWKG